MSSISGIGSAVASTYAVAQPAATKPQPRRTADPQQNTAAAASNAGSDADGDGDHDAGGIDISG